MLKIGLTGGIASGKSTLCTLFSQHNIAIIDADIIAREVVEPNQAAFKEIVQLFGNTIIQNNGTLNRKQIRQLVFSNTEAKQQLEDILHPRIRQQLIQQSDQLDVPYCILAIPLLLEADMSDLVDRILVVDIEIEQQIKRLCQRDNISLQDAQSIIASQSTREQRLAIADDVISNANSIKDLTVLVSELHTKYGALAKNIQQ
ncbi:MAG: dephospho-CoA kinase [Piscirickettsiaceae bacterium]|nr:dephospho-CoA kinase [Piscirickettsiaceae bacterium]